MTHPMRSRLALRPDLNECVLEGRCLLAYSPTFPTMVWTQGGLVVPSSPPGYLSFGGPGSGPGGSSSVGGSGGNLATSFNLLGFGTNSVAIGNSTGFASTALAAAARQGLGGGGGGGGGGDSSPAPAPSRNLGYGAVVGSGGGSSLGAGNNYGYGMSTSPVGSVPVHTFANNEPVAPANQNNASQTAATQPNRGTPGAPTSGPVMYLWRNLLNKKTGPRFLNPSPTPSSSSLGNP